MSRPIPQPTPAQIEHSLAAHLQNAEHALAKVRSHPSLAAADYAANSYVKASELLEQLWDIDPTAASPYRLRHIGLMCSMEDFMEGYKA